MNVCSLATIEKARGERAAIVGSTGHRSQCKIHVAIVQTSHRLCVRLA